MQQTIADPTLEALIIQTIAGLVMLTVKYAGPLLGTLAVIWWKWYLPYRAKRIEAKEAKEAKAAADKKAASDDAEDKRLAAAAATRAHGYAVAEEKEREERMLLRQADDRRLRAQEHRIKALEESRERVSTELETIGKAGYIDRTTVDTVLKDAIEQVHREDKLIDKRVERLENWRDRQNGNDRRR